MSLHNDTVYLRHMLDHAEEALGIAEGKSRETLEGDPLVRYALLHLF